MDKAQTTTFVQKYRWYFLLFFLQLVSLILAFPKVFSQPNRMMMQNQWDGFKNYLTLHAYMLWDSKSILQYDQMNYPYGDLVFFTDNSPLFSFIFKTLCSGDSCQYGIGVFNLLCLLLILLSPLVLFRIFEVLKLQSFWSVLASLILIWQNPQMMRINNGHFNLSAAIVLLLVILQLIRIFQYVEKEDLKSAFKHVSFVALISFVSAFWHIYYLPLILLPVGVFLFSLSIRKIIKKDKQTVFFFLASAAILFISLALFLLILRLPDGFAAERAQKGMGYGWDWWEHQLPSLFATSSESIIQSPIGLNRRFGYEGFIPLGWFILGTLCLGIFGDVDPTTRKSRRFLIFFFIAAATSYFASFGDTLRIFGVTFKNYLNVLEWVRPLYSGIENFRCSGRFAWFFYWAVGLYAVVILHSWWRQKDARTRWLIIIPILMGFTDIATMIKRSIKYNNSENHLHHELIVSKHGDLFNVIKPKEYDALLPLPFYHTGTSVKELTIDPYDPFFITDSQLSIGLNIPNIGSKMARTSTKQAQEKLQWMSPNMESTDFSKAMKDKTILVVMHRNYFEGRSDYDFQSNELTQWSLEKSNQFLDRYPSELIFETDELACYKMKL